MVKRSALKGKGTGRIRLCNSYGDDCIENLYEQGKFTESEHSKECVREVQRTSDSICAFIDESLVRAKGKRLKRSEVFHMYEEYCKENGRQGHGKSNFSGI